MLPSCRAPRGRWPLPSSGLHPAPPPGRRGAGSHQGAGGFVPTQEQPPGKALVLAAPLVKYTPAAFPSSQAPPFVSVLHSLW